LGTVPFVSDGKKVFDTGDNIVKMADAAKDAAKAAEAAGDVTKANKAADAADVAVDATRRGVEGAEATGDAAKVAEAQANVQKAEAAAQEAREAAQRAVDNMPITPPRVSPGPEPDSFRGDWPPIGNDPRPPIVMGKRMPDGGVELSDVYRRGNAPKSGGDMIAETLKGAGIPQPTRIRITNIESGTNAPTYESVISGVGPEGTPLGNAINTAIASLGGTPTGSWQFGLARGKVWIERNISY
jgi:hypothetical protein